jgi:luciferase family oxidoreductase group 1
MFALSVLDLAPITQGSDAGRALRNTLELAQRCERLGYARFWLAEHHNMPGVASAATAVVIGHVASGTTRIRVGAGGIMLPNHAPLIIAEQFGTLEALYPGRIDLGLGRAPGSDPLTQRLLRRDPHAADSFADDVLELQLLLGPVAPDQPVRAVPGAGTQVPLYILGSSLYGAQLAAALGLPFAFASHFAPAQLAHALAVYRARFQPSAQLERPYVMLGLNAIGAGSTAEARFLFSSLQQAFVNLRRGRPGPLPPPDAELDQRLGPAERLMLEDALSCTVLGTRAEVREGLHAFAEKHGADELIVSGHVFDHVARLRSFEIVAEAAGPSAAPSAVPT